MVSVSSLYCKSWKAVKFSSSIWVFGSRHSNACFSPEVSGRVPESPLKTCGKIPLKFNQRMILGLHCRGILPLFFVFHFWNKITIAAAPNTTLQMVMKWWCSLLIVSLSLCTELFPTCVCVCGGTPTCACVHTCKSERCPVHSRWIRNCAVLQNGNLHASYTISPVFCLVSLFCKTPSNI